MDTNDIIKKRRKELGMTLQEVADIVGVSKSTILRYETKEISNMSAQIIPPLAKALKCTESYLLGLTDVPTVENKPSIINDDYTYEEEQLINAYRNAPKETQQAIRLLLLKEKDVNPAVTEPHPILNSTKTNEG